MGYCHRDSARKALEVSIRDDLIALNLISHQFSTNEKAADVLLNSDVYHEIGKEALSEYVAELRKLTNPRHNWTVTDWIRDIEEWILES